MVGGSVFLTLLPFAQRKASRRRSLALESQFDDS